MQFKSLADAIVLVPYNLPSCTLRTYSLMVQNLQCFTRWNFSYAHNFIMDYKGLFSICFPFRLEYQSPCCMDNTCYERLECSHTQDIWDIVVIWDRVILFYVIGDLLMVTLKYKHQGCLLGLKFMMAYMILLMCSTSPILEGEE